MMIIFETILALILIGAFIHFKVTKRKDNYQISLLAQYMNTSDEFKKTLAMGLYLRFKAENAEDRSNDSTTFIEQDPLLFEDFTADLFEQARGGTTWVSPPSGDYGVDFEHRTQDGLFLGQVKCYHHDVTFDPIALIHSNMIKRGAKGGYVITTSSFTSAAREYAQGLDIELIDGVKLVELWLSGLVNVEEEIKTIHPKLV